MDCLGFLQRKPLEELCKSDNRKESEVRKRLREGLKKKFQRKQTIIITSTHPFRLLFN